MNWLSNTYLFIAALICSAVLSGALLHLLNRWNVIDHPNERSSHNIPTPRGGGLAVMVVALGLWALAPFMFSYVPKVEWFVLLSVAAITIFFWIEDVKGLSLQLRLGLQLGVSFFLLLHMGAGPDGSFLVFKGLLPPLVDMIFAWLLWVWFINLFNFMDGIDGISAAEAIIICLGVISVSAVVDTNKDMVVPAVTVAGAMAGFFVLNRPPAKIFLGDVGSISLGLILGWMLLQLAANGLWLPAIILPLYYLADASITLVRRTLRGERFWRAHSDHFYQAGIKRGLSHGQVSFMVFLLGLALIGLAVLSLSQPLSAMGIAIGLVGVFLFFLKKPRNDRRPNNPNNDA